MRYLNTYIKEEIIDQINETIDDLMVYLIDDGFTEVELYRHRDWDILKKYTRKDGWKDISVIGTISNGKIEYKDNNYDIFNDDASKDVDELTNTIKVVNSIHGLDIHFSYTDIYEEETIIINAKI
jgi:hypothetical protein